MKKSLFISALLFFYMTATGQSLHNIRFVYAGEETHPVGTLSISVEKIIVPKDRRLDSIFGKTVKTDIYSFNLIANYIKESKYLHPPLKKIGSSSNAVYRIILVSDSTKDDLYLIESDFPVYFLNR